MTPKPDPDAQEKLRRKLNTERGMFASNDTVLRIGNELKKGEEYGKKSDKIKDGKGKAKAGAKDEKEVTEDEKEKEAAATDGSKDDVKKEAPPKAGFEFNIKYKDSKFYFVYYILKPSLNFAGFSYLLPRILKIKIQITSGQYFISGHPFNVTESSIL